MSKYTRQKIQIQDSNNQHEILRVFTSNVRGVVKNWDSIKQIKFQNYDIILLNEIWQIRDFEELQIPDFILANIKQRELRKGGGTLIFLRKNIEFEKFDSPFVEGKIETASIVIKNNVFTSVYRPPSGNKSDFTEQISTWIESIGNKNLYLAGDLNLNYLNEEIQYYNNIEQLTGLKANITEPTRISSLTCIDNILTNMIGEHSVSQICIADHQGMISKIRVNKVKTVKERFVYREMKERNWLIFANEVSKLKIRGGSINDKWNNISNDVKIAVEKSFPEKSSNIKYTFHMSRGLLKSKNKKNKLLSQYKRGIIPKEVYTRYNKIYRKLIQAEQEKNFKAKIEESGQDSKKKWKVLKDELKISKTRDEITRLNINGTAVTKKEEIAISLKNHFQSCATELANNIDDNGECEILTDQKPDWTFEKITEIELQKIIDTLLPKASCGFDLLSNRMLKAEKQKFSKLLLDLVNETLIGDVFPDILKTAKIIPIFKKGDKTNPNNYRPISLLPVFSKVLEKAMNNQITEKLNSYHIIDDDQYGFRTEHSTEDAVLKFIDYIEKAKLSNKYVVSIHIDVSKAFDSCNHVIMAKKLRNVGLTGKSLDLMKSYMKDRAQELWIGKTKGGRFVINIGVGQGTVLGPTLFKIYIMDMYLATNLFSLRFADDSNFVGHGSNREDTELYINRELVKLHTWFCKNKLTLHPDKSRIIIHTKDKMINIKLGDKNLMRCGYGLQEEGVKFLGVIIDENLDWKLQVNQVKKKIGKGNYILWRYRNKLSVNMKRTIYESFIRTHLTYCLSIWGAKKTGTLNELKKLIKKVWSKIGQRRQHTNKRLMENKILKLEDELKIAESKIVWRWLKNKIPLGLKNIIVERNSRNLRNRQFIRERRWKHDSISYRLATRAKNDIKDIEIARSKKGLARKLKNNCILVEYNTICRIRNCLICTQTNQQQDTQANS